MDQQELRDLEYLRDYNKNLINLLRNRQRILPNSSDVSITSSSNSDSLEVPNTRVQKTVLSTTAPIIDRNKNDVLGMSQPFRSKTARKELAKKNISEARTNDKYSKYEKVDPSVYGKARSLQQGIETTRNDYKDMIAEYERELDREMSEVESLLKESYQSIASNGTLASTPLNTPPCTPQGTPKSILKRRKLIDDNIKVNSDYPHTPIGLETPKGKGLNYSYTDIDDMAIAKDAQTRQSSLSSCQYYNNDAIDSSYKDSTLNSSVQEREQKLNKQMKEIEELLQKNLLLDSGNDRKNAGVVRDLSQRPKAVLFDLEAPEPQYDTFGKEKASDSTSDKSVLQQSANQSLRNSTLSSSRTSSTTSAWRQQGKGTQPLLGYDWIAGVLDNESSLVNQPDDYFKELNDFRRTNKHDCISKETANILSMPYPISPAIKDPKHTCIHGYTLTDRLFTQPMNVSENGKSVCPICLIDRKEPTQMSPGFVRVSVPRSTLASPYRVVPHRRRSFDETDTYALSNHCLQGWQNAKPSAIPTASTLDIKKGIKDKEILSYEEVQKMADSISKLGSVFQSEKYNFDNPTLINSSKMAPNMSNFQSRENTTGFDTQIDMSTTNFQSNKATKDLLNTSHLLRAQLQQLEREKGLDTLAPPNSTNYPLF